MKSNAITYEKGIIGKTATKVYADGTKFKVRYHNTEVFILDLKNNTITLDTGGWFTVTTKRRMNEAARAFGIQLTVFQQSKKWYAVHAGVAHEFLENSITITRCYI